MGIFSWLRKSKTTDQEKLVASYALGPTECVVKWCSAPELGRFRQNMKIPERAENFEEEMFYLYVFLVAVSFEVVYTKRPDFGVSLGRAFMKNIYQAVDAGRFDHLDLSTELIHERYEQYLEHRVRGIEDLLERLPYTFLVTNGVCPSETLEDMELVGYSLMFMEHWVGNFLIALCNATSEWADQFPPK